MLMAMAKKAINILVSIFILAFSPSIRLKRSSLRLVHPVVESDCLPDSPPRSAAGYWASSVRPSTARRNC